MCRIYTQKIWQLSQMPSHHFSDITLILHCGHSYFGVTSFIDYPDAGLFDVDKLVDFRL